jgi:5'-3' exonuclease
VTLLLLDSASLWYRAYFGMPETLVAPDGQPVQAIRGFLDMTSRLITQYRPNRIVACLEGDWRPSWRVDLFPEYKANRLEEDGTEEEPDTLGPQIPILLDLLDAFGIPLVGIDDFEADDVMASFAAQHKGPIRIATGDRDLFQVIDPKKDVRIVYLARGIAQHDLVDRGYIEEKYGIPGDRYALFAMIRGDSSDGLPGVRGIGEKGAAEIAKNFQTMDEVIEAAKKSDPRLKPSLAKKILDNIEYAKIATDLVTCVRDLPLPDISVSLPQRPEDLTAIREFQQNYALGASIDRFIAALGWAE